MRQRYQKKDVPWDATLPPPEVISLIETLTPGRALDVGCGYGRTAIFLEKNEWQVTAVDFVAEALEVARARAKEAGATIDFRQLDITALGELTGFYDLAIDIGCAHNLPAEGWQAHHSYLKKLLGVGATYLLYGRVQSAEASDPRRGIDEKALRALFKDGFKHLETTHGITDMGAGDVWASAWFRFERL